MLKSTNWKLIALLCSLHAVTFLQAQTKTDSLQLFFSNLNRAFESSDVRLIVDDLNDNLSVGIASYPSSGWYLEKIITSGEIKSVQYESIKSQTSDTTLVNAKFNTVDGKSVKSVLAFDSKNKLLFADYFDSFYVPSRYAQSEKRAEIPFILRNNSIILPLKLNDSSQTLYFLMDTGADGMAIRKSLGDSLSLAISRTNDAIVVGGNLKVDISAGNSVHLSDDFSLENQSIALFENMGDMHDGIIGLNLAKEYIVTLNYDTKLLSLFTFGDYLFENEGETIQITVPKGLVMIPGLLNIAGNDDVEGNFILDTGAHYHLICFEKFVRKNKLLLSGFKSEGQSSTESMGVSSPVFLGKAFSFEFGNSIALHNMPITLQASTGRDNTFNQDVDGSIGNDLIGQFNITIDLLRKLIHLKPNSRIEE